MSRLSLHSPRLRYLLYFRGKLTLVDNFFNVSRPQYMYDISAHSNSEEVQALQTDFLWLLGGGVV